MPNWNKVLEEIQYCAADPKTAYSPVDIVRRRYLQKLSDYTGRNVIAYYSGWLQAGSVAGTDINDLDTNGFMTAINGLDCSKGLDLMLHTPGGMISTAEHIVSYLKSKFGNNIRAIIPQIALSAGTMISCSCKEIIMGKQSCLGPFDPQYGGISAIRVIEEFGHAIENAKKDKDSIPFWQVIIGKYHPTFLDSCKFACERSKIIVREWLKTNMFCDEDNSHEIAEKIVEKFTETGRTMDHDKHINLNECQNFGLKILALEKEQRLQDLVLTVHHAFMHTLSQFPVVKAIENQNGIGIFNFKQQ